MLSEETVLKAIVECMDEERNAMFVKVMAYLGCEGKPLLHFIKALKFKGYITQTLYDAHVTDSGMREYNRIFRE